MSDDMTKKTIPPAIARMLVNNEGALVGVGKMVFCDHDNKTLFGGVAKPNIDHVKHDDWRMTVGTLIWVPCDTYVWHDKRGCGWELSDLIKQGMAPEYWARSKP